MPCAINPASEELADFIYRYYSFSLNELLSRQDICYDFVSSQYLILHRPLPESLPLSFIRDGYDSIPNLYSLLDSGSMESAGILKTFDQPRLSYKGRGTVIGIIDTGIDYLNPIFRNPDGTTKILEIWDQTIEGSGLLTGTPFDDIRYGTVFSQEEINEALRSDDPFSIVPSRDENGHGTAMAAIAAGSATAIPDFTGAAPEAGLVIVRLKKAKKYLRDFYLISPDAEAYQENDIMLGIKFLLLSARRHQLPITILIGAGTNMGSHEGTSPLAQYITEQIGNPGQIFVLAAGNETGRGHHYLGHISAQEDYEDVEMRVGNDERGFTLELWARESELYSVGFLSPSGEEISRVPISAVLEREIHFLLEDTIIYLTYTSSELATGSQLIIMRFEDPAPGLWHIRVYNSLFIEGQYHMWLPVHGFLSEDTFFLQSSPDTTVTDPGNTPGPITTAAYNHRNNSIYIHSSRGFARSGAIKPELAAPGVAISAPQQRFDMTGTSIAAAHTAGAAASLLSWAVLGDNLRSINTLIAKSILIRGADRKPGLTYPNREWGYGTLNLYQSFLAMRE